MSTAPGVGPARTLVIGAGFLGSAVVSALLTRNLPVTVLRREPRTPDGAHPLAAEVAMGGLTTEAMIGLLRAHSHVLLAAGGTSPALSQGHAGATMQTELELIELVVAANSTGAGPTLTYLSSGGAIYGNAPQVPTDETCATAPISDYGYAKLAGEELIRAGHADFGIRARILRVANAFGPGQPSAGIHGIVGTALRSAVTGEPMLLVDSGRAIRDFVYVDDIVTAILATMTLSEDLTLVNVGSGVGTAISEVVQLIESVTGLSVPTRSAQPRPFDVRTSVLAIGELQRRIPFVPTPLRAGVATTWSRVRDQIRV